MTQEPAAPRTRAGLFCTLLFPLSELQLDDLRGSGWVGGRLQADVWGRSAARLGLDGGDREFDSFLAAENSCHRLLELPAGHLKVAAAEAVRVDTRLASSSPSGARVEGYLIVHVEAGANASEVDTLGDLGEIARPSEPLSREAPGRVSGGRSCWRLAEQVERVPTIALTAMPDDEDAGLVRWPGSTALQRRLASLVVLRRGTCDVPCDPSISIERPTPSYVISSSTLSTVVCRLRDVENLHVQRLRTFWTDVLLVELVHNNALAAMAKEIRGGVRSHEPVRSTELEKGFRDWRTSTEWRPEADHPFEQQLASIVRDRLGTARLVDRVERETEGPRGRAANRQ